MYELPGPAAAGLHDATSVGPVVSVLQTMSCQPLLASPTCGVQLGTPVGPVATVLQVTPAPLPFGPLGVQELTFVVATENVRQYVAVKPLPALGGTGVHDATSVQVGVAGFVVHVLSVNALPALAAVAEHEATSVGPLVTVLQVVVTYPFAAVGPELAGQVATATGVGPVVSVLQVVST